MNANPVEQSGRHEARRQQEGDVAFPSLDIEVDERARSVRVYDPRLFHSGRQRFCRRLIEAVSEQAGIRKAEIDLTLASCRIEFIPGSASAESMSRVFVSAIRQAAVAQPRDDRRFFWRYAASWFTLTAYPTKGAVSLWETLENKPGRTRLRHRGRLRDQARLARLAGTVANLEGVENCRASSWFRQITIEYRPDSAAVSGLLDAVERSWEGLDTYERASPQHSFPLPLVNANDCPELATGLKRLMYLALAAGSFVLTIAAVIVPGIPTVPCLIATGYFLARSSPRLNARLRRLPVFGPTLTEWEQYGRLSRGSKEKLIGLTLVIVAVTVALAPLSAVAVVVIVLLASLSIYEVVRMPGLADERQAPTGLNGSSRLALPAP